MAKLPFGGNATRERKVLRGKTLAWKARNRVALPREGIQLAPTGRAGETEAKCAVNFLCREIGKWPKFPALAATFTVVAIGENRAQELPIELERIKLLMIARPRHPS